MKFRVLDWSNEAGKDLVLAVVNEFDCIEVRVIDDRVGFKCNDTTMVAIIGALRDAINESVFISCI